jgi:hypothetical protein
LYTDKQKENQPNKQKYSSTEKNITQSQRNQLILHRQKEGKPTKQA